tara:strand:+ start:47 stop:331 length:285 start_codon:yes stop_codon:yes gene_type:complete
MARRGSSVSDLKKKRKDLFTRPDSAIGRTKNSNQGKTEVKKSSKKMTGKERAQAMAKKRIASGKTTSEIKAANKLKIKQRAAEKYAAFKKKKKK